MENLQKKEKKVEVTIFELFFLFFFIGSFTIGGGFAMIPFIRKEMIEKKQWMEDGVFLENLALAQSLPGPIVVNISLLTGYRLRGIKGSLFSVLGVIIPSFAIMLAIIFFLWQYRSYYLVQAAFIGIKPVVFALIVSTIFKLGKQVFKEYRSLLLFVLFLLGLVFLNLHPIAVLVIGAIIGLLWPLNK